MTSTQTTITTFPEVGTVEVVNLYGWEEDFARSAHTIRARLFGEMVRRAQPIVHEYQSDLYHDVHWLETNVDGPCEFDYLVRYYGTNIAESARIGVAIGAGPHVLYKIALTVHRGQWTATFTVEHVGLTREG